MTHLTEKIQQSLPWKFLLSLERFIIVSCSLLSILIIVIGVALRYVFQTDLYGMEEFIVIIAFWLYFMGGAYGAYEASHIRADLISVLIKSEKVKSVLSVIEVFISTGVGLVLTWWGFKYFMWGLERGAKSPGWRIPLVFSQSPIFIGFALMTCYFLFHLIRSVEKTYNLYKHP